MTLPVSPDAISLSYVNTELHLAATAIISMNDSAVRTLFGKASGIISLSDGHGKSNEFPFTINGGTNINLRTAALAAGWNGINKVIMTNTGIIAAASTGTNALTVNGSFPNGVTLINNNLISGAGGAGGVGSYWPSYGTQFYGAVPSGGSYSLDTTGGAGGPALSVSTELILYNNGTIQGGGGGGGGGYPGDYWFGGSGGGGGAGIPAGNGGVCQIYIYNAGDDKNPASWSDTHNRYGTAGTWSSGGSGGPGGYIGGYGDNRYGNHGGSGGAPGSVGGSNVYGRQGAGPGGAGGAAIVGNAYITYGAFGTRTGALS
jgi:hypothetical protein